MGRPLRVLLSVPRTFWEITEAASQPDVGLADIARIVEHDAAMSVKVLQLVNSSYFGLAQRQTSVRHAVAYLGTEMVKALALTANVFVSAAPAIAGVTLDELQRHSLLTARIAKRFFSDEEIPRSAARGSVPTRAPRLTLSGARGRGP
ncbi:MAG TPA: HDOD domain-containing protein [Vulgatibacter sp.]|nr:HDOD domain-containing protein [Vulgatibacter sp.]